MNDRSRILADVQGRCEFRFTSKSRHGAPFWPAASMERWPAPRIDIRENSNFPCRFFPQFSLKPLRPSRGWRMRKGYPAPRRCPTPNVSHQEALSAEPGAQKREIPSAVCIETEVFRRCASGDTVGGKRKRPSRFRLSP